MSNFYTKPSDLVSGTTARASDINDRVDSAESGFDNVELVTTRSVKLPVGTTTDQLITESATNRASKTIGFDSSGDLVLYQPYNWEGDWTTSTAYVLHDTVRDSSTKNIYFCMADHTSGTFATDLAASKWSLAINVADVETAKTAAQTAQTAAELAETNAETAETNAETAETNAETAQTAAETAKGLAEDWAVKTSATVDGTNYSAKYWATSADVVAVAGKATQIGLLGTSDAISDMNTLGTADVVSDLNTLGTADVVSDLNTLGTSGNVTNMNTLAGISANITTAAGISTDITTVAGKSTQLGLLGTTDAIADMNTLGTADIVSDMNTLGTADVVSDMNTLGTADVVSDMNTLGTADVVTDMNVLGTSSNVTAMNTLGTSTNVTNMGTLSGISANITTVAGISSDVTAVAAKSTQLGLLGTADAIADMNTLGTSDVVSDMNTLGTSDVVSDMNTLGTSDVVSDMNTLGTSTNVANMATVATNITDVNTFAEVYRISSSAPTTSLTSGDLYFDTTANILKVYGSSGWQSAGSSVNGTARRQSFTATASQTTFTVTGGFDSGFIDVYLDGIKLHSSDFTDTSGTSVVLASGASVGQLLDVIGYGTFSLASISTADITDITATAAELNLLDGVTATTAELNWTDGVTSAIQTQMDTKQSATADYDVGDNVKIKLGNDDDLQIYHDGLNSYIKDNGIGDLLIYGTSLHLRDSSGWDFINCLDTGTGGTVSLFHDGSPKLATTSSGISVTGTVAATAFTGDGSSLTGIDALPTQTGHSGKYLTTDATNASWATLDTDANSTTKGLYEMANTISSNYSITSGNNAISASPITINSGISVTIPTGSTWVIA